MRGKVPDYLRPHVEPIEAYRREVFLDLYLRSSGERTVSDGTIHARYPELNDGRLFHRALAAGDLRYARALMNLYFMARLGPAQDRLAATRLELTVALGGEIMPIGRAMVAWSSATTEEERRRIGAGLEPALERLALAEREWFDAYGEIRGTLGFATQADLNAAIHDNIDRWLAQTRATLSATRDEFLREAAEWRRRDGRGDSVTYSWMPIRHIGLPPGAARSEEAVRRTAAAWGFAREAERIPIDLVARPGKLAGALCARIDPPTDVRVTSQPTGDSLEYVLLLHEFGHGLHFTVGPDRPFDLFGDDQAITEGFGITFESAACEPAWFREFAGITLDDESLARLRFANVLSDRLQAVHVLYEHRVFSDAVDPAKEFVEIYRREIGLEISPHRALTRMLFFLGLQPFYALYLHQARVFRDALWQHLTENGGPTWFANDQCHSPLVRLFRAACELDLDGMFTELGVSSPAGAAPG